MNAKGCLLGALAIVAVATGARAEPSKYCATFADKPDWWSLPVLRTCAHEWSGERRTVAFMLMRAWEARVRLQEDNDRLYAEKRQARESAEAVHAGCQAPNYN